MSDNKRIKTTSKNGIVYYKNPADRNRDAQKKHYDENSRQIKVAAILKNFEKGMCPRPSSIRKYPEELTEQIMLDRFRKFKDGCNDPEMFIKTSRNFTNLLKAI